MKLGFTVLINVAVDVADIQRGSQLMKKGWHEAPAMP